MSRMTGSRAKKSRARGRVISYNDSAPRSRRAKWRRLIVQLAIGVVVFGAIGLYYTGRFAPAQQRLTAILYRDTAAMGLRVTDLALQGRIFTSREEIAGALGVHEGDPTLAFDPARAKTALESLPRVASAEVDRRLPGTIDVRIVERAPIAIWQKNGKLMLIDKDGIVLGDQQLADYGALPHVVGEGAAKAASEVLDLLGTEPELARRVTACVRVGERRWDLKLDNNVTVKLPETGEDAAIRQLAQLETKNGLLEHDVLSVDMRLPGKLVIETSQPRDPKAKPAKQQGI